MKNFNVLYKSFVGIASCFGTFTYKAVVRKLQHIRITSILAIMLTLSINTSVLAGSQIGKITHLTVRQSDGLIYFNVSNTAHNKPSCATHPYWMIRNEKSQVGKVQYAMLLTAQAAKRTIAVTGNNTCSRWGDGEDVNAITLLDR